MYYVYLIESEHSPPHRYVGSTSDVEQRLLEHNSGKSKYTTKYKPWPPGHVHRFQFPK